MTTITRLPHSLRPATSPPSPFRSGLARIRFGPGLLALLLLASASTGCTIRCTSIGTGLPSALTACLRSASQTIGPKVRFGT
jgi:hypothetical protein